MFRCALAFEQVQRGVDRGAPQVRGHVVQRFESRIGAGRIPAGEAQEDGLEHVFGVGGIAGDPVCGAEDHGVVRVKGALQGLSSGKRGRAGDWAGRESVVLRLPVAFIRVDRRRGSVLHRALEKLEPKLLAVTVIHQSGRCECAGQAVAERSCQGP